uniref:Uncharacterized protein n=1 Tax=Arundo donax TaxID=35708 RepID=A0A0A9AWP7_ARUDO
MLLNRIGTSMTPIPTRKHTRVAGINYMLQSGMLWQKREFGVRSKVQMGQRRAQWKALCRKGWFLTVAVFLALGSRQLKIARFLKQEKYHCLY